MATAQLVPSPLMDTKNKTGFELPDVNYDAAGAFELDSGIFDRLAQAAIDTLNPVEERGFHPERLLQYPQASPTAHQHHQKGVPHVVSDTSLDAITYNLIQELENRDSIVDHDHVNTAAANNDNKNNQMSMNKWSPGSDSHESYYSESSNDILPSVRAAAAAAAAAAAVAATTDSDFSDYVVNEPLQSAQQFRRYQQQQQQQQREQQQHQSSGGRVVVPDRSSVERSHPQSAISWKGLALDARGVLRALGDKSRKGYSMWMGGSGPPMPKHVLADRVERAGRQHMARTTTGTLSGVVGNSSDTPGTCAGRAKKAKAFRERRKQRVTARPLPTRYEIRKIMAQTRPRVKGRFVKRESSNPPAMRKQ